MICRACGAHFCYVCGQRWELHNSQSGGLDYYNCRLGEQSTRADAPNRDSNGHAGRSKLDVCRNSFTANVRDAEWERGVADIALRLAQLFNLGAEYGECIASAVEAGLTARRVLRCSYVLRFNVSRKVWSRSLETRVAELEVVTERLEAVSGLGIIGSAARQVGLTTAAQLHPEAADRTLRAIDLREVLAHAQAMAGHADFCAQLALAVQLQTSRLLDTVRGLDLEEPDDESVIGVASAVVDAAGAVAGVAATTIGGAASDMGGFALGAAVGVGRRLWGMIASRQVHEPTQEPPATDRKSVV